MFDFAGNGDKLLRERDLVKFCEIYAGDADESGKKRIADGGPHDVSPKESWSSTQKSKCLV